MFYKDASKNFAKFTGNTCVRVFFNKVYRASACNFIQKEAPNRDFPGKFAEQLFHNTTLTLSKKMLVQSYQLKLYISLLKAFSYSVVLLLNLKLICVLE